MGRLLRQEQFKDGPTRGAAGLPLPRAPQRTQPRDIQDGQEGAELQPLLPLSIQGN